MFSCNAPADLRVAYLPGGTVDASTETALTVRAQDGTSVTCSVPAGIDLSKFGVGTGVKINCRLRDGQFRLGYLKSDSAVIEIER
jgi:hypothetical protein